MEIPENLKTVDGIVAAMREEARMLLESTGSDEGFSYMADLLEAAVGRERDLASLRAIHAVEMAERDARRETATKRNGLHCGDCARFGRDCDAGDVDGNEDCAACERFVGRPTGNLEKMQEALWEICDYANGVYGGDMSDDLRRAIRDKARAALSATARNCDRGRDAAEDAFTARFGRPWTQEEARVAEWLFEEEEGVE